MQPLSEVKMSASGCRVIAFDRPPFGLTERPMSWEGGDAQSPYSTEVCWSSPHAVQVPDPTRAITPVSTASLCWECMEESVLNSTLLLQGGARLAAGLLEKLGVDRAIIVGHSAGGCTALELYRRCRLICCS